MGLIREIQQSFAQYPPWLVGLCLLIVVIGLMVLIGKLIRGATIVLLVLAGLAALGYLAFHFFLQ